MPLFQKREDTRVRSFIVKLVNNNCPELKSMIEGSRRDSRVNLTVVVMVIPLESRQPQLGRTFTAVTKEFSSTGTAIVLDHQVGLDEAVLAFRFEGEMTYIRAKARHLSPIGGGFHQLGFEMLDILSPCDYPELKDVVF